MDLLGKLCAGRWIHKRKRLWMKSREVKGCRELKGADFDVFLLSLEAVFRLPDTLRPLRGQPLAVLIEIHQREAGAQSSVILFESAVSHLIEAEDALQYPEGMFHFCSDSGLGRVLALGLFVHIVLELGATAGHVLSVRSGLADNISLSLIAGVSPHLAFLAM
jgi:hypothetical protein